MINLIYYDEKLYPQYKNVEDYEILKIDQFKNDIIYTLSKAKPDSTIVEYVENGLYDRILENFKEHIKDLELPDNEKYEWNQLVPAESRRFNSTVNLCRPGKEAKRKKYIYKASPVFSDSYYPEKGDVVGYKLINVVKIRKYIYRSATYPEILAYTFGDSKGNMMIKPFKIMEHDWQRIVKCIKNYSEYLWICKKCSIQGSSHNSAKRAIVPTDLLTCDEVVIRDIIL
jgi:hypothetical protein